MDSLRRHLQLAYPPGSTPMPFAVSKIYKIPSICTATCGAQIYYVFGSTNMTRACVHLGLYEHPVKAGENQEFKERKHALIGEQV
jgi:hypothetical protein